MKQALFVLMLLALAACSPKVTVTLPTVTPTRGFMELPADRCATCGTNTLIGGWESDEGGILILNEDGTYLSAWGNETWEGVWYVQNDDLCLTPNDGKTECLLYEHNIDFLRRGLIQYVRR